MTYCVIVETLTTKVGNEEYDAVSYNVDYYDVKRFDDGELTIHELINSAFDPAEQVNVKQAEFLGAVFVAAMGGPAHCMLELEAEEVITTLHGMTRTRAFD